MNDMLIILGAMKCGSTSLFKYLARHPHILPSSVKEPDFFSDDSQWQKGFSYYDALWEQNNDPVSYRMEASVSYTKGYVDKKVIRRMKESGRNIKFIYIVRDPFERIESHYTHGIADNWEISRTTSELVSDHAIKTSMYFWHIEPFLRAFGEESILVLGFRQLNNAPDRLLKKVCNFLQLGGFDENASSFARHNASADKRKYGSIVKVARKLDAYVHLSSILPESLRKNVRDKMSSPIGRYTLTDVQKQYTADQLADDFAKFSDRFASQVTCANWEINQYLEPTMPS